MEALNRVADVPAEILIKDPQNINFERQPCMNMFGV